MTPATPQNPVQANHSKRRGVVLVAVLVVVVLLALAGYHYADMMLAEAKACEKTHQAMQAQKFADSGIHYAAAMLSNPDNFNSILNGNPWNNQAMFQGVQIQGDGNLVGYFDIVAPPNIDDLSDTTIPIYGVQDEGSKINLNAQMKIDPTGKSLYNMLMALPITSNTASMTNIIAANIVTWMGGSYGISQGGYGDSYYMSLPQPYHCKSGPIDSIDELMLVQGVTWDLLYGSDLNRNGIQEDGEMGPLGFVRGWSAFLTVHSREQNSDINGNPYIYLNNTDMSQLYGFLLEAGVDATLSKFIIMYRQYGGSTKSGSTPSMAGALSTLAGGSSNSSSSAPTGDVNSFPLDLTGTAGKTNFTSIFQLCNCYVTAPVPAPTAQNPKATVQTVFASPLNDIGSQQALLPTLFQYATLVQSPEIPARINVNTAPMAVLAALPGLQLTDVQAIIAARPDISQGGIFDENFQTPAWLLTNAQLSLQTLQTLDQYITTRSQVYRVQSVGYFDGGKGPSIRLEAVIDTNAGRPRILAWRTLSELGKGWTPGGNMTPAAPATSSP